MGFTNHNHGDPAASGTARKRLGWRMLCPTNVVKQSRKRLPMGGHAASLAKIEVLKATASCFGLFEQAWQAIP